MQSELIPPCGQWVLLANNDSWMEGEWVEQTEKQKGKNGPAPFFGKNKHSQNQPLEIIYQKLYILRIAKQIH